MESPEVVIEGMADDDAPSKSLGIRIQGKIASKMSTKGLAKQVVDGPTSDLIDNCYKIAKTYLESKKDAEKIMKNMIKLVVKVAILSRNNMFTKEEITHLQNFQKKFKTLAITIISFYEVDFTFDGEYMIKILNESRELLELSVKNHLTDKSLKRIDNVYSFYSDPKVLDKLFLPDSSYRPFLENIVNALNKLIDNGEL
ncbi:tumor necrosis factor alpha-induced protein 8-like protein isoform X2 [Hydractinia symbiolongicarpus]|uniref:tumor necrosis factor alpha-induced protein 8-like protein isoform X2 n=1 Tax=Hydractinia symbiolongicarpus TaxID=13093 RepID=UPI00254CB305|nr:tumor necrosis factor alpha-induced protein 8-like protein isoform X2 [Hydractinia symbiolongicarpus]